MKLLQRLQQVVLEIKKRELVYALAGGLAASLYRKEPRATADIDLAILTENEKQGESILAALGLKANALRKAQLEGGPLFAIKRKNTPVFMLCGRDASSEGIGVDLILSGVPWVGTALDRSQANQIDFGFGGVPCLTLEDLIVSKFYSVGNQTTRFMDLDDLRSILESENEVDWIYVRDQMKKLKIRVPEPISAFVPKQILS